MRAIMYGIFLSTLMMVILMSCSDNGPAGVVDGGSDPKPEPSGICGAVKGQLFSSEHPWNQIVTDSALDTESSDMIAFFQSHIDDAGTFQIDGPSEETNNLYGLTILTGSASDRRSFTPKEDEFYQPDCDPAPVPVPPNGAIEGESGYECSQDGDCHHIVIDKTACRLYEMWRANISGGTFYGGCLAVWDLTETYSPELRGECCTSADAAGLPIAALTFTADDIAAGKINHALRFILPNRRIRDSIYVKPATHATSATSGPQNAPPYGARLRLKGDFDSSKYNDAAKVVIDALKTYGMIMSDGGSITFTAANDRFTQHKWADVGLGPHDLIALQWSDFEVVELGRRFIWGGSCDCSRTPVTD
jgi:serine/threonine-protein kinase